MEDLWERRTPEELWQWAKDPKPLVRRRAAENPHTPPEILEGLAEDEDLWVRRAVAANPSTPGETLRKLARDKEISVRKAVAGNPSAPAETLAELAKDEDIEFGIGVALAGNPRTPGEALAQRLGPLEGIFIVHLGGAILSGIPLLWMAGGNLGNFRAVPWLFLLAGGFGVIVVAAIGFAVPRIGVAPTTVLLVVGQLLIGTLIDQFGWMGSGVRPLDLGKIIGLGLLMLGAWLVVRPS